MFNFATLNGVINGAFLPLKIPRFCGNFGKPFCEREKLLPKIVERELPTRLEMSTSLFIGAKR